MFLPDGSGLTSTYLKKLDLSNFDTSKVQQIDYFVRSSKLEILDVHGLDFTNLGWYVDVAASDNGKDAA